MSGAGLALLALTVGGAAALMAGRVRQCRHWRTHGDRRTGRAEHGGEDRRREAKRAQKEAAR